MAESVLLTSTSREGVRAGPWSSFFVLAERNVTFTKSRCWPFKSCYRNSKEGARGLEDCYVGEDIFLNFIPRIAVNPVADGTRNKRAPLPEKHSRIQRCAHHGLVILLGRLSLNTEKNAPNTHTHHCILCHNICFLCSGQIQVEAPCTWRTDVWETNEQAQMVISRRGEIGTGFTLRLSLASPAISNVCFCCIQGNFPNQSLLSGHDGSDSHPALFLAPLSYRVQRNSREVSYKLLRTDCRLASGRP